MRIMRKLAVVLTFTLGALAPLPAHAQEPSPEAATAAQNLFALLFDHAFARQNELAVDGVWPSVERALRKNNPALDEATLTTLRSEFARIRREQMKALVKEFPHSLARHLGPKEMDDLAAFYRTPSGRKVLEAMPLVLAEGFAQALPRMRALNDDTHTAFMALLRERGLLRAHP
jgi:hypothetical protein